MNSYKDVLADLELRSVAHRLAAEFYSSLSKNMTLAAGLASVITASASYWSAFDKSNVNVVGYVVAAAATITAILNVVIAKLDAGSTAEQHLKTAKKLEDIWVRCTGESMQDLDAGQKQQLISKTTVEIAGVLREAPLLEAKFETRAKVHPVFPGVRIDAVARA